MNAMNPADAIAQDIINAGMAEAVADLFPNAEEASPKKASKAKPAKPAKANAAIAKEKAEAAKAIQFKAASGEVYDLAAGADPKALKSAAADAAKALGAIGKKDADLLSHYLALGKFQSSAAPLFKSSKLYGQFLAKELPASQDLDAALRSNSKWLWEALNKPGAEGGDLLVVLNVNRIEDYKSKNPTVIKRDYKAAKAEAEKLAAAEEMGLSVEEAEAQAQAEKEAEAEKLKALVLEFAKAVANKKDKAEAEADIRDALLHGLFGKKKEAFEFMQSVMP
ncbi:hypothetical protein Q9295_10215 [Xinfangfangia sp. CPCC 101601]|uniref:Uncharacterized protein n=1 Tax=Pseudogemmobacter lacusdianii TaxID=3069608 RepID=A0ABU0VYE5_9RHOB|nr:hypothetical protein [Xinfangfangia sp. CPCC 101601]MDQ2066752.1 hypothetical protein [Xinfangfangia sp. CPCC 101601]